MDKLSGDNHTETSGVSRRALLCGFGAVTALSLGFNLEEATAATGVKKLAGGKFEIDLVANKSLAKVGGAVLFTAANSAPSALVRTDTGAKDFAAVSLVCPHAGVSVKVVDKKWLCPAHGSLFNLDGKFLNGPAGQSLNNYPVTVKGSKAIIG